MPRLRAAPSPSSLGCRPITFNNLLCGLPDMPVWILEEWAGSEPIAWFAEFTDKCTGPDAMTRYPVVDS